MRIFGPEFLKNSELLAIIIRTGSRNESALHIGEKLMTHFGSLNEIAKSSLNRIQRIAGIGPEKALVIQAALNISQRLSRELVGDNPILDSPEKVAIFLYEEMRLCEEENLFALYLNTRNRLIQKSRIGIGTLDSILVHPREVFRRAISFNASSVILVHNHPSGDAAPSPADIRVTREIAEAGSLLRIPLLDHVIIGAHHKERKSFSSLKELGLL